MATTTTKTKKAPPVPPPPPKPDELAQTALERRRQVRLGVGIFLILAGVFMCFSIISYFFSWMSDQDKLFGSSSMWSFVWDGTAQPVANWGGRFGAAVSHILVYKGAGIASLVVGMAIAALGLHVVYDSKVLPALRYIRWVSILLLLVAPTLTYLFPHSSFPLGGRLGSGAITYLNGFLGTAGTGMVLLATILFFVFVIFSLDIRPFMDRMRARAAAMAASVGPAPVFNEPEQTAEEAEPVPAGAEPAATMPVAEAAAPSVEEKQWEITLHEGAPEENDIQEPGEEPQEEENEEYLAYQKYLEEKETAALAARGPMAEAELEPEPAVGNGDEPEFSFEVIQQEEQPAITHGSHISIASNEPYAPELDLPDYRFPTLDLMEDRATEAISLDKEELEKNKTQIIQTLRSFGIEIQRISATVGPTVTLYEIVPAEGVRISKIRNLEDDIALNLSALGIRIIAPIPGRGTIGIEVPNTNKQIVSMRTLLGSDKFVNNKMSLPIALGKKIDNENYIVDLAAMPHLLMAGATGQGKSVGINAILVSLLYKKHPSQLKFVMVDPKKVELSIYRVIEKHFLAKLPNEEEAIITDTKKVINTLNALCIEMDNRYELLKEAGTRNIKEYNEKFISRKLNPERGHKYLPFIVLVVDEFADLIMTAGKEVEMPIARLAQLARAIGIHLIIATQRPSVNVITGTIKANFPARIAFKVSAKVDSRTILDTGGAEQLIGRGDMLISYGSELLRLQCAFVDTPEVEDVVNFIGRQRGYLSAFELPEYEGEDGEGAKEVDLSNRDKLFEDCARLVVQMQSGSTSNLQRRLNLGYNRAGRIMDQLEAAGIVGPAVGSKPREVYFKTEAELEGFLQSLD
ncbi:DNA translocase FtsK [Nemorincola caseinilytica]|uniref:DNA translocase FtsK n=1 Tax=Nemorincola caseinilytica TaxID=2054315 RepID=A0ABP8NAK2_9BACT